MIEDLKKKLNGGSDNAVPQVASPVNDAPKQNNVNNLKQTIGINSPVADNVNKSKTTARQTMMAMPAPQSKWYKGNQPTSAEMVARIYSIGKVDSEQGRKLFDDFSALRQDPTSPIYDCYATATNPALTELKKYGLDVSGWKKSDMESALQQYSANGLFTISDTSGNPNKPSTKASAQEWQAYWLYQVYKDEDKTEQAETEWQALQDEIKHWTNDPHNYSDDEILGKVDWSNYRRSSAWMRARPSACRLR